VIYYQTMQLFQSSSSAHWYDKDGKPCHSVPYADKKRANESRPTNLTDARKLNLLPSVTSILGIIAKPQLDDWKQTQAVMSALTLPRKEGEIDDDFAKRVVLDSREQVSEAASRGTKVHAAIEQFLLFGEICPDVSVREIFLPFVDWAKENILDICYSERVLVGDGYAGTCDLKAEIRGVGLAIADFKTRRPYNGKFAGYITDNLQLSAYRAADALHQPHTIAPHRLSIFINSEEPSLPHVHPWPTEDNDASFAAFMAAFTLWKYEKNYNPSV